MIKALIFDLDNCLAAADETGEELYAPAFAAIRQANRGSLSEESLARALADCWRHPLDWVAAKYGFSREMLAAGWDILAATEINRPMTGYGDLWVLSELPAERFLVTSGFRRLQASKVRALGLQPLFAAIHIDAIDEPNRKGKQGHFEDILDRGRLRPSEALVIGDSADSEIAAGDRLGIPTVQTLRPGVPRAENATFHVRSFLELRTLLSNEA